MGMLIRSTKAIVLAVMVFFSLHYLGVDDGPAVACALVPMVLGFLNVLVSFAFGLAGLVFIVACTSALVPDWRHKAGELASWAGFGQSKPTTVNVVAPRGDKDKEAPHDKKP